MKPIPAAVLENSATCFGGLKKLLEPLGDVLISAMGFTDIKNFLGKRIGFSFRRLFKARYDIQPPPLATGNLNYLIPWIPI